MKSLEIRITGKSGYLGEIIGTGLLNRGHRVSGISRTLLYEGGTALENEIAGSDVVIHLAGAPILQRWNKKNKQVISNSRVVTTQNLVKAISILPVEKRPGKLISASATGIYQPGKFHSETSTDFDEGFAGKVVADWEKSSSQLIDQVIRIVFRIAPVLGKKAKMINNLKLPFYLGFGATIGNGRQPFPFIHEKDLVKAFVMAAEDFQQHGVYNLVAPNPVSNREFTRTLASVVHRPAFLSVPGFFLKLIFGEAAEMLVSAPAVIPENLLKTGFTFDYPDIRSALKEIFG